MTTKKTLKELFESRKDELVGRLTGLSLPKDAVQIQTIVTDYLNELFDSNGDFRQNLTQSEDYVLQAAMSLLNAQQSMTGEFASAKFDKTEGIGDNDKTSKTGENPISGQSLKKEQYPYAIGGSAIGGAAGALLLGTWGAVFGAIAGTALVLYNSSLLSQQDSKSKMSQPAMTAKPETPPAINVNVFIGIVANICNSIDSLIETFRVQISRVADKYESKEKPTLEKDYGILLDCIQSLLGVCYQPADEKKQKRIDSRIEQLAESLENYDLEVVKYDENHRDYFQETSSDTVNEATMVLPAILKHGKVVRTGRVLINKQ